MTASLCDMFSYTPLLWCEMCGRKHHTTITVSQKETAGFLEGLAALCEQLE